MKINMKSGPIGTLAVIVVLVVISFFSIKVYASLTNTTISVCVEKDGTVHVVGSDFKRDECKKNETLLTWNAQGEKGDKGDQGLQGLQGEQGPVGLTGGQGIQGPIGQQGVKGDTGPQGIQGEVGPQGLQGPKGDSGVLSALHLYDASGQDLGTLAGVTVPDDTAGTTRYVTHYRLDNGQNIIFQFTSDDNLNHSAWLGLFSSPALYFPQPDCQGDPFIGSTARLRPQVVFLARGTYFTPRFDTQGNRTTYSRIDGGGTSCINSGASNTSPSFLLTPVSLPFSGSLSWPLEIR